MIEAKRYYTVQSVFYYILFAVDTITFNCYRCVLSNMDLTSSLNPRPPVRHQLDYCRCIHAIDNWNAYERATCSISEKKPGKETNAAPIPSRLTPFSERSPAIAQDIAKR